MNAPVLGVNFGTHDAAAAVVAEGRVLAAGEEERFTRTKHTKAFPEQAISYCLAEAGMDTRDVGTVALFVDPRRHLLLPLVNLYHGFPASFGSLVSDIGKYRQRNAAPRRIRASGLFRADCRVVPVVHHRAHAASAYLLSPFDDAVVVTIDGRGEYETACVFEGRDGTLVRRHSIVYPHSIGYLYSMITRYLGFRPQRDEYKVMGLAAYGSLAQVANVNRLARFDDRTGRFRLDLSYFDHHCRPSCKRQLYSHQLEALLGPSRRPDDEITDRHRDIAYALQQLTERLISGYLDFARRLVPSRNLCLAGGVALNGVANAAVLDSERFDQVFIQPAANDAGTSVGAALLVASSGERHRLVDTFLGPSYDERTIRAALDQLPRDHRTRRSEHAHQCAAELVHAGKVIGWFQGRMEFGPRALGARSILATATDAGIADRINALIKRRELFRPLGPAVLAENGADYFDIHSAGRWVYPFMLATAPVKPNKRTIIPAVVHIDGSARVQTVERETNPRLWSVIDAYRALSGVPVVLNTSFNGADEPIVCTPDDAVRTYLACGLDALVIGPYVVDRP
ncbi:MAG: carbamoyltransferase [Actinophytocola sp.]|uniref:carbamoyltransferase family protein n=1 Tax=Actinophytocola sp. TaxID=1872138 RepID=UPI0013276B8C|nr:carbamoyltransferase C-terminal domain-containing protein [Actinophytocola sp.]MPZ81909.1 carbamoyltransferase [Actinophytocola sp.]